MSSLHQLGQDVRYTLRMWTERPGFTAVALAALAFGIGANTAVFSVVYGVAFRPLPFPEPERIVRIWETRPGMPGGPCAAGFSLDHFREWREKNQSFEQLAAYQGHFVTWSGIDEPVQLSGVRASPSLFALLGTPRLLGRTLSPEEETPGRERVLVLSHSGWRRYFASDPSVVGRVLRLDGNGYTVVGVMPAGFEFPDKSVDFWTPLVLAPPPPRQSGVHTVQLVPVVARLKPGVTLEQAEAEGRAMVAAFERESRDFNPMGREVRIHLRSLLDQMVAPVRPALLVLLIAVAFVLLIACANVANLLLVRASERRREMAIRSALGAGRARLLRQVLTESLLLALTGGALGLLLAYGAVQLVKGLGAGSLPRLEEVRLDPLVLGFTAVLSLLCGVVFGLAPALEGFRVDVVGSLKAQGGLRKVAPRIFRQGGFRSFLVVAEIALALVLLIGAGLLLSSFVRLIRADPGYDSRNVLTTELHLPAYRYSGTGSRVAFYDAVLDGVKRLPGVTSTGVVSLLPLSPGNVMLTFAVADRPEPARREDVPRASFRIVSPGYFSAMGIRLLAGRDFVEQEGEGSPPVVIVNELLGREYFPGEDPVGKRIEFGEIVGVVKGVKHEGFDAEPRPEFYIPYAQAPPMMGQMLSRMTLVVRTAADAIELASALRGQLAQIDPELPVGEVRTMESRVSESVAQPRFYALALGTFALVALLLATVGLYGLVSYSVAQRTAETGIRMALGARSRDILQMILAQGLVLILFGIGLGLPAAIALSRLLKSFLYQVSETDPVTYAGLAGLLAVVGLLACYVPARRASRLDPLAALRYE